VLESYAGSLRVLSSRPFGHRFLVRLEGVGDRPAADALRGAVLRAAPEPRPGTLWVHELVGAQVVDLKGAVLGRVDAVEPNPASDLLVLEGGGLVPLRFVVRHTAGTQVVVDVPDGLLD
jgi:16S rRNA processing protein RimM